MKHLWLACACVLLAFAGCQSSRAKETPSIAPNDAQAIRTTLDELYAAFGFEARGGADWNKIRDLCADGAIFVAPVPARGTPRLVGIDEFLREFHEYVATEAVRNTGLHERILHARIDCFGKVAHAYVAFEGFVPGLDVVTKRGLDSIQLAKFGERWKVVSFTTQNETTIDPLPTRFLRN